MMHTNTHLERPETLLRAVADPKRRAILEHLRTVDETVAVEQLPDAFDSHGPPDDRQDGRSRTIIELQHSDLPLLADANLVAYDREAETVTYRGDERADALLTFITERLE